MSARWARRGGGLMLLAVVLGMPHTLPGWETRRDLTVLVLAVLGLASSFPWAWFWPRRVTPRLWRYSLGALCVAAWGAALFYGFAFILFLTMPVGILQNREYAATLTSTEVGATFDLHHWTNWDGDIRRSDLALRRGPFEFVVWEGDIGAAAIDVRRWGHRLEVQGRPGGQCEAWIDGNPARWDFAFAQGGGEPCFVATTKPPSE